MTKSLFDLEPDDRRHGTVYGYQSLRCRCDRCRTAWAAYHRERGYSATEAVKATRRDRYRLAREAGFSPLEAQKRQFWSDPLRKDHT